MKRLFLIRHAQSDHHIKGLSGGWTDTSLSELGRAQAALLARRCAALLSGEEGLRLYSSDLARAAETAAYIAEALGIERRLEPALREHNNGRAAGLTVEEARRIERPVTTPRVDWVPYPEAESWRAQATRVYAGMDRIAWESPGTTIVVTHGGSGVAVILWWLRQDPAWREGIWFPLDPASITLLEEDAWGDRTIVRLNDTAHLAAL